MADAHDDVVSGGVMPMRLASLVCLLAGACD